MFDPKSQSQSHILKHYKEETVDDLEKKPDINTEFRGLTIYFILHSLTLITAFSWYGLIEGQLNKLKGKNNLLLTFIFVICLTLFTAIMHIALGNRMIIPS
tara:strand:- start:170 stop:472 length:303 start_codon:yes stop_codon:yes gene_type:complete